MSYCPSEKGRVSNYASVRAVCVISRIVAFSADFTIHATRVRFSSGLPRTACAEVALRAVACPHQRSTRLTLAFGVGRRAVRLVLGQRQFAQCLQIAPQRAQTYVTLEAASATVPTTLQTIARLQGADHRLHTRMTLMRLAKGQFSMCRLMNVRVPVR